MVAQADLPEISNGKPLTGDDSFWSGAPLDPAAKDSTVFQLPDGGRIVWQRDAGTLLKANTAMTLKFGVLNQDGKPVEDMEPYMGMTGHAELVRSDLSVFAHIHSAGSVSMAALELAQSGLAGRSTDTQDAMPTPVSMPGMEMNTSSAPLPSEVSFPYGFPRPGDYRIFVQVKRSSDQDTLKLQLSTRMFNESCCKEA